MSTGRLALAGLRGHARRLGATALAILLSVGFVATTMLGLDAMERGVGESVAGGVIDHDIVLTADPNRDLEEGSAAGPLTPEVVADLRAADGLVVADASLRLQGDLDGQYAVTTTLPSAPGVGLLEGRLPVGPEEVAASSDAGAQVGETVTFTPYSVGTGESLPPREVEVVGVVDVGNDPQLTWQDVLVADEAALVEWDPDAVFDAVVIDLDGAGAQAARDTIAAAAPGALVRTGPEEAEHRMLAATGGMDLLGAVLLGFGAIAVATSALVIANTFAIVLAQRTRELALLRCVGATRSQVRRTVLTEALALGIVAATAGVLGAVALTWVVATAVGEVNLGTPITLRPGLDPVSLVVPWLAGVLVTLAAAWWPTRRATKVAPVAALHPVAAPVAGSRPGVLRIAMSVVLLGAGAAGLLLGAASQEILVGVAGGLVSFLGVVLAAVFFVPAGVRGLGALLRGVPGRLAVGNTVSNPARAAATSAALLIGVTLITMTSVGAASVERTAASEIDASFPADVMVMPLYGQGADGEDTEVSQALPPAAVTQVAELDQVQVSVPVTAALLEVATVDGATSASLEVLGVDPEQAAPALRDPSSAQRLEPGALGVSEDTMSWTGLQSGDRVELTGPGGSTEATVVTVEAGDAVLTRADLETLAPGAGEGGLLIKLTDDADVSSAVGEIRELVGADSSYLTGGAQARQELTQVLSVLVLITTALLGVAVVIAVVGIANTLALSVLERTRENALLRALGLTRGQLRAMLTVEGVLLAVVSTLMGLALGATYAWFGVRTLLPEGTEVQLVLPWVQLSGIVGLAVVAGLLASVLPARRAARVAPAAGLATG